MARRKIDKAALASLIRDLKELSNEQKADLLQLLNEQKRYGLVWEEHKEEAQEVLSESIPVLVEDKSKAIIAFDDCRAKISEPSQTPNHILIEGDNLHALTALTYTHEDKVDVIYIDPPYNTGNKDFVYNDSFVDSEDGYRHSKWLSFMEKRLRIAKKLLSDRGVIFISIDDNEQANLKLLCDQLFSENNFIANVIWKHTQQSKNDERYFSRQYNHTLVYAKAKDYVSNFYFERTEEDNKNYSNPDNDPKGLWRSGDVRSPNLRKSLCFDIVAPNGNIIKAPEKGWRWSQESINEKIKTGEIKFKEDCTGIIRKIYLCDQTGRTPENLWEGDRFGTTRQAAALIKDIFNGVQVFDTPKPIQLVKMIISLNGYNDSTILDFFAGSGTTLHATMQLNVEDGGHRKCILVTNNENGICENVTYERNKRVINGYTTPKGVDVAGLKDNNLRFYRTEFVPRDLSATGQKNLMLASTDLLCIKNDLYDEKDMFGDIKLRKHIARYFDDGKQRMLIIYKIEAIESLVEEMAKMPEEIMIKVYVFSTNNYAMDEDFEEVADKVELYAMPAALWNAYKKVLPRKRNNINEEEDNA